MRAFGPDVNMCQLCLFPVVQFKAQKMSACDSALCVWMISLAVSLNVCEISSNNVWERLCGKMEEAQEM